MTNKQKHPHQLLRLQQRSEVGVKGTEMKLIQILVLATAVATLLRAQNATPTPQNGAKSKDTASVSKNTTGQKATGSASAAKQSAASSTSKNKNTSRSNVAKGGQTKSGQTKTAPPGAKSPSANGHAATGNKAPAISGKGNTASQASMTTQANKKNKKKDKDAVAKSMHPKAALVAKSKGSTGRATGSVPAQLAGAHGRRDPFVSPIHHVEQEGGPTPPPCTSGKRCLAIPEIILQGTVKDTNGKMMALVATGSRMYMLRENDQVFNGSVGKITSDSVTFREYSRDKFGKEVPHEVVKRLTPTS